MIRVKGYGQTTGFMGPNHAVMDHDAHSMRVTALGTSDSGAGLLLELLTHGGTVVAAYAPGRWLSAHVVESASEVPPPARTVTFEKES